MKVTKLTRNPKSPDDIFWDPNSMSLDVSLLEEIDAVVHLAGENISNGRWTKKQKSKAKRNEIRTKAFEETKLLNFFNVGGIRFNNIATNIMISKK